MVLFSNDNSINTSYPLKCFKCIIIVIILDNYIIIIILVIILDILTVVIVVMEVAVVVVVLTMIVKLIMMVLMTVLVNIGRTKRIVVVCYLFICGVLSLTGPIGWTPWGPWGDCSDPCGNGYQLRSRKCEPVAGVCEGSSIETRKCKCDHQFDVEGNRIDLNHSPCTQGVFIMHCKTCSPFWRYLYILYDFNHSAIMPKLQVCVGWIYSLWTRTITKFSECEDGLLWYPLGIK